MTFSKILQDLGKELLANSLWPGEVIYHGREMCEHLGKLSRSSACDKALHRVPVGDNLCTRLIPIIRISMGGDGLS